MAISKKILAIQEAISTSSPVHSINSCNKKQVSPSTLPNTNTPTPLPSTPTLVPESSTPSPPPQTSPTPLSPTLKAPNPAETPPSVQEEKPAEKNGGESKNHSTSSNDNNNEVGVRKDLVKCEKQGIDNALMNGDIHHPDKIEDAAAVTSQPDTVIIQTTPSPLTTVEQRNNNNNNIRTHNSSKQAESNRRLSQLPEEQQLLLRPESDTCLPVHDDETEYIINFPSAEQPGNGRQHLCAQHEALAAAGGGGNRSNSHSHVSAFVSAPIVGGRMQNGQNGHAAANRKDKRNNSNRKTPIRQRLIINLDDKNKFTEEVTV